MIRTHQNMFSCVDIIKQLKPRAAKKQAAISQIRSRFAAKHGADGFRTLSMVLPDGKAKTPMVDRASANMLLEHIPNPEPGSVDRVRAMLDEAPPPYLEPQKPSDPSASGPDHAEDPMAEEPDDGSVFKNQNETILEMSHNTSQNESNCLDNNSVNDGTVLLAEEPDDGSVSGNQGETITLMSHYQREQIVPTASNVTTTEEFFHRVRKYNNHVSAIDVCSAFSDNSSTGKVVWLRLKGEVEAEGGSVIYHQFSGKGQRPTPCVDADGALYLIMRVPGKAAVAFRHKCFNVLKRYFAGDTSLNEEIAANAAAVSDEASEFLVGKKRKHPEYGTFEYLDMQTKHAKKIIQSTKEISSMIGFDIENDMREKMAFQDWGRRLLTRLQSIEVGPLAKMPKISTFTASMDSNDSDVSNVVSLRPVVNTTNEISIPLVCQSLNIRYTADVARKAGSIGRKMKQLFIERHGNSAEIPKRKVIHNNRPILENVYYEKDTDLMEQAIRVVLGHND